VASILIKLLIADDEAMERKALKFLLEKFYKDRVEIVDEANNGKAAVERAILYKPDIVLMDIKMPLMDGLEASSKIKADNAETEIIIFTAYSDFEYAKRAIGIGVNSYLLKPCSREEFKEAMDKTILKIETASSKETEAKELKENYQKAIPYIEKQMIVNIVYGITLTNEQIEEYKNILGIHGLKFCCILLNFKDIKIVSEKFVQFIKNGLGIMFPKIVSGVCLHDIVFFIFDEDIENKVFSRRFEEIVYNLKNHFTNKEALDLNVGISSLDKDFNKLYKSYLEAKKACELEDTKKFPSKLPMPEIKLDENNHKICGRIINEDLEGAIVELDIIFNNVFNQAAQVQLRTVSKILSDTMDNIIEDINEFTGTDFKNFNKENSLKNLEELKNSFDLRNGCIIIIKQLIKYISGYKRIKNIDVVEKTKKYIALNYMKDLSLDLLAKQVSLSSFYLSRIFTKIEGSSIKEYIIKVRMEKAKAMLSEGNKTIKQIGIEVGYSDPNYFSKAFKKYTQVSPKEYYEE
jgi:two-component system response regulator YesN